MEELLELKKGLETERPARWEELPDISLYMDQVVGYMPRQLIRCGEEDRLTPAMVNNYIKDGLLPRAEGKRYNRDHLAYLTAICALKQVLSVKDAGLLASPGEGEQVRDAYERFRAGLDQALNGTAQGLETGEEELSRLALTLALRSYADKLACQRVIELLRKREPRPAGKRNKERKEDAKHE